MIIVPGYDQPSVANMIEMARTDSLRRVNIELQDQTGASIDIEEGNLPNGDPTGELELEVTDIAGNSLYSESYWPKLPTQTDHRIVKVAPGKYYIKWGTGENETDTNRAVLFNWHSRQNATTEDAYRTQILEVISPKTLTLLPSFRLLLDKVIKPILPERLCFLGWSDGQLIMLLKLGLHYINEHQPYPTFSTFDLFPITTHSDILIKAALYQGITSQLIFAIDTDIPSYNDQGHSFVQVHAQYLSGYLSHLKGELDKLIREFKLQFVDSGTAMVEMRMDMAYGLLLASSPVGALYRGIWATG